MRKRGFTLIELLIAIGIVVILAAMLIFGTRAIIGGSKSHSTHIALENCKSMLGEYEAASPLKDSVFNWIWWDGSTNQSEPPTPNANSLNYWFRPVLPPSVPASPEIQALDAPGYVKDDSLGSDQRNGSRAILNTSVAMGVLARVPASRQALLNIPLDQTFVPNWTNGKSFSPGANRLIREDNTDPTAQITYPTGAHVKDKDGKVYVCLTSQATSEPMSSATDWRVDSAGAPMIKDGWGNPIILVPATGMLVRLLNTAKDYNPSDLTQTYLIVSPEGSVANNGTTAGPTLTRAGRPFFASAGPDGDFTKGDDNIYSFEQ